MKRGAALVLGLLCSVLSLLTWNAAPAAAGDVTTGSWTQLRASTPVGESPDLQPTDGHALPVVNTALGPVSIAAIRFASGATTLELTRVDPTSALPAAPLPALPALPVPAAVVWACPATGAWTAGDRQPWANRPTYDCAKHAVGSTTAGGMYWDLESIAGTAVDVVLVPAPGDVTPYSLSFAAPTAASFQTSEPEPPPVDLGPAPVEEPVSGTPPIAGGSVSSPGLPAVAVSSSTGGVTPPVTLPATQASAPQQVAAVLPTAAPRWVGAALLAFLALVLMTRAALPSGATVAPRSLLAVHSHRETT